MPAVVVAFLLLFACDAGHATAVGRDIYLGTHDGAALYCSVSVQPEGSPLGGCLLTACFTAINGPHRLVFVRPIGYSFRNEVDVETGPYLGLKRRQVFLAAQYGRRVSEVLDFDGRRVREVYGMHDGRNTVVMAPWGSGQWKVVEEYAVYQIDDGAPLGLTRYDRDGTVHRSLYLVHGSFRQLHPGPLYILGLPAELAKKYSINTYFRY